MDDSVESAGAVYAFRRTGAAWTQESYNKAPSPSVSDYFGGSVAARADRIAAGAVEIEFANDRPGFVAVLVRTGGAWTMALRATASNGEDGDDVGNSVVLLDEGMVTGSPSESGNPGPNDNNAAASGAAYFFR